MSSLSARRIEVVGTPGLTALYYGCDPITSMPQTRLMSEGQEFQDEMFRAFAGKNPAEVLEAISIAKYCDEARIVVVGPSATELASKAIVAFSQGEDVDITPKSFLSGLVTFTEHLLGDNTCELSDKYPQLTSSQVMRLIEDTGLTEEYNVYSAANCPRAFFENRTTMAAYWQDVFEYKFRLRNGVLADELWLQRFDNMEGRRRVAAAHVVQMIGLATGALYAACVNNGDQNAGLVADLLDPLLRI